MSKVVITDDCMGCGCCSELCKHGKIQMKKYHASIEGCEGCSDCEVRVYDCPGEAIKVEK